MSRFAIRFTVIFEFRLMNKHVFFTCAALMAFIHLHAADLKILTLTEARQLSLQHHPRISAAKLAALAARERVVQARSAYFPVITVNATAVGTAEENTRIAAGSLSNPSIF